MKSGPGMMNNTTRYKTAGLLCGIQFMVNFEKVTENPSDECLENATCGRRMLRIDFDLSSHPRSGWMFNVGDSVSNNGWKGDSSHQFYDAETDGLYPNINVWSNDKCNSYQSLHFLKQFKDALLQGSVNRVTLYISNMQVRVTTDSGLDESLCHECLYALNGQYDPSSQNSNEDIYIGINRVVSGTYRRGYGICSARLSWVCPPEPCCNAGTTQLDLRTGSVSNVGPSNITVVTYPQSQGIGYACSKMALLKVNFEKITENPSDECLESVLCGRRMLRIDFDLSSHPRSGWMFNVGDSVSNNGWKGDSSHQFYDAETDGLYPNINVWSNDKCNSNQSLHFLKQFKDALLQGSVNRVTLYISNMQVRVTTDSGLDESLCHECLYALNGQYDPSSQNSNEDIYIGINRVVSGTYRRGYGICSARLSWVSPPEPCCNAGTTQLDLRTGSVSNVGPSNVTVMTYPQSQGIGYACSKMALLKVNFEKITENPSDECLESAMCGRRMLRIDFDLSSHPRSGWMFNVGDSVSNNGWKGDSNHQFYDAETDGLYPNINVWSNDKCNSNQSLHFLKQFKDALLQGSVNRVTLYISNMQVRVTTDSGLDEKLCHECLYALNGQYDPSSQNSNEDIYIGINRVVSGTYRRGYGICSARLSWVCPSTA